MRAFEARSLIGLDSRRSAGILFFFIFLMDPISGVPPCNRLGAIKASLSVWSWVIKPQLMPAVGSETFSCNLTNHI